MENQKPTENNEQSEQSVNKRVHPLWHIATLISFALFVMSIFTDATVMPMLILYLICGWKSSRAVYQEEKNALDYIAIIFCFLFFIARSILKYVLENAGNSSEEKAEKVYTIRHNGFERKLKYYGRGYNSVANGGDYDRYIDDLGNYWKTYDGGKTFSKED